MTWYHFRLGRLALAPADRGPVWDARGRWAHVVGPLWWLQAPGAGMLT